MRDRLLLLIFAAAAIAAAAVLPTPTAGQARGTAQMPDLQGIWQVSDTSLAYNVEPHTATYGVPAGQGAIADTPNKMIPYLPAAAARRQDNLKNRAALDPINQCFKPGVPRITYLHFPFQIIQTPTQVTFVYEYIHNTRNIYLNRKEHLDGLDFWNGDSIGRYEGNTLVVDVADFNDQTWLDASGNHHSEALKVQERYTRTDPNTITYEVTLTDPKVYSRPWKMSMLLYRHREPNFRILEYECHAYAEDAERAK